jgi:TRAP-type C4-dicarboxylate transport system substrate-binding protein
VRCAVNERSLAFSRRRPGGSLLALALVLATAPVVVVAQGASDKARELTLSTAVGPAFALGKAGERWAKLVIEKSGGKLSIQLRPGAILAERDPAREFIALRDAVADLAVGSTLYWSAQVRALGAVGLPWIAAEDAQLAALTTGAMKEKLMAAVLAAGAMPLALAPLGHRELATIGEPVRSPDDIAGRAVRIVSTPFLVDLYAGLGARPQAMALADAISAFRSGKLDAQEGAPATLAAARLDAVGVRHVTLWGAVAEVAIFAVNRVVWERSSEAERAIMSGAAEQAAQELAELARTENEAALGELRKRGVSILRLTASGQAAFAAAARPVYDKWAGVAGDEIVRAAEAAVRGAR